jgi:hypothetical protein
MDRKLARKNIVTGLVAASLCIMIFGLTFLIADMYIGG